MVAPKDHYRRYQSTYEQISDRLDTVRQSFIVADTFTQKVMLLDANVYAVMSVQNSIEMLRRAFEAYCRADTWDDVKDAFQGLNYGNNKYEYVRENVETIFGPTGTDIIERIESGEYWDAIEIIVESLMGVSYVKAPFMLCMLGFKDLMCIDTNVEQMVPDDSVKSNDYSSGEQYRTAVELVKDEFSELSDMVEPFMLQWVVFDTNRQTGVAKHEEWFDHVLPGSMFSRQVGLDRFS